MDALYIRMPRCGSTSIASFCKKNKVPFYSDRDMGFWGRDTLLKKNTSDQLYQCVLNYVGKEKYEKDYIFSSVRNPYSRAVSIFNHRTWRSLKTFKDFCSAINNEEYPSLSAKWHSAPIIDHLLNGDDLQVDFIIRLENHQEDLGIVCDKIGVPRQQLPHKNKSKYKPYTEYYDDESRQMVEEKYGNDIDYFGYEFGK
jgi:hypothetical protein